VLEELIALGARRAIRVGTCGALEPTLALGDLVIAREAISADGASRALGIGDRVAADTALTDALARSAPSARVGAVVSVDLFYERERSRAHAHADALAVEMEAAALLAIGAAADVAVACVLAVTDTFAPGSVRTRIDEHGLRAAGERLGEVALAALGTMPRAA
jgi:uridine phosphorylase